jgi:hypothetical protein
MLFMKHLKITATCDKTHQLISTAWLLQVGFGRIDGINKIACPAETLSPWSSPFDANLSR